MGSWTRRWLPATLLVASAGVAWALAQGRPIPTAAPAPPDAPWVRVAHVVPETVQLRVRTHGSVQPRTETDLVPEISGRVRWVSAALAAGGSFAAGERLLEIEPRDYALAERRARARLERAASEAELAAAQRARIEALAHRDAASKRAFDEARHAARAAAAAVEEAAAALEQAQRDLERTTLRAPFAGRVRGERVDVGQFVARGTAVARLYAVDFAEVRLPVRDADLAFLDVSLDGRPAASEPEVVLRGPFAGRQHQWRGRVVRTEGEIDASSRMVHLVARVDDPYGGADGRPPLAVGLFVEAEILGHRVEDALVVPRAALHGRDRLAVVDGAQRLRFRAAEVLRVDGERVVARAALEAGDRVCLSALDPPLDGMRVRPLEPASEAVARSEPEASGVRASGAGKARGARSEPEASGV
ncbi:MAG: efflux RND transporter periplasmic adaptor subunit, partial [Myxococcota bacterium]|nr:efflux RND transporter periplasmic adaptor subunit [Myxococcota bacterium]